MTTITQFLRTSDGAPLSVPASGWVENDSQTAAEANASRAAAAGRRHIVTGVTVYADAALDVNVVFGSTTVIGPLTLTAGGTEHLSFWPGLAAAVNEAVSVTVAAGGVGEVGTASIQGYTVED